jgi:hypothetical protein
MDWIPPVSPVPLLQELYWPDQWKILVCCLLLNQTSRKQVDPIIHEFFEKFPNPQYIVNASDNEIKEIIKSLGLYNRRTKTLKRFSADYLNLTWKEPLELYGCGKYANDTWHIFCRGLVKSTVPDDHALNDYRDWFLENYESNYSA